MLKYDLENLVSFIWNKSDTTTTGTTKKTFTISKANTLNAPSPLNQCCKSREREKIKNCTCFDNEQHWLKGGRDLSHYFFDWLQVSFKLKTWTVFFFFFLHLRSVVFWKKEKKRLCYRLSLKVLYKTWNEFCQTSSEPCKLNLFKI